MINKFFFLSIIIILTTFSKITNSQSFNGEYAEKLNAFVSDFQVNEDFGSGLQNHSAIAMDDSGNFIIVWDERRNGVTTDIYAQRFLKEGVPIGKEIKVNSDSIYSNKYFPEIGMYVNGNFIIAWGDRSESKNDIYFQRFSKNGNRIDDNIKVNDFEGQYPRLAIDGSGNFLILWQDIRNTFYFPTLYAQFYSKDGFRLGNNFRINDENKVPQGRPNLSVNNKWRLCCNLVR